MDLFGGSSAASGGLLFDQYIGNSMFGGGDQRSSDYMNVDDNFNSLFDSVLHQDAVLNGGSNSASFVGTNEVLSTWRTNTNNALVAANGSMWTGNTPSVQPIGFNRPMQPPPPLQQPAIVFEPDELDNILLDYPDIDDILNNVAASDAATTSVTLAPPALMPIVNERSSHQRGYAAPAAAAVGTTNSGGVLLTKPAASNVSSSCSTSSSTATTSHKTIMKPSNLPLRRTNPAPESINNSRTPLPIRPRLALPLTTNVSGGTSSIHSPSTPSLSSPSESLSSLGSSPSPAIDEHQASSPGSNTSSHAAAALTASSKQHHHASQRRGYNKTTSRKNNKQYRGQRMQTISGSDNDNNDAANNVIIGEQLQQLEQHDGENHVPSDDETADEEDDSEEEDAEDVIRRLKGESSNAAGGNGLYAPRAGDALMLTVEERRLLVKEGRSLPSHYPLTREQERLLKMIRRKIRNKLSAMESRRKKKVYVDCLEDELKRKVDENVKLRGRVVHLERSNDSLQKQLQELQSMADSAMKNAGALRGAHLIQTNHHSMNTTSSAAATAALNSIIRRSPRDNSKVKSTYLLALVLSVMLVLPTTLKNGREAQLLLQGSPPESMQDEHMPFLQKLVGRMFNNNNYNYADRSSMVASNGVLLTPELAQQMAKELNASGVDADRPIILGKFAAAAAAYNDNADADGMEVEEFIKSLPPQPPAMPFVHENAVQRVKRISNSKNGGGNGLNLPALNDGEEGDSLFAALRSDMLKRGLIPELREAKHEEKEQQFATGVVYDDENFMVADDNVNDVVSMSAAAKRNNSSNNKNVKVTIIRAKNASISNEQNMQLSSAK